MSAKSTAQPETHTRGFFSRPAILVSVIVVVAIFLTIIIYRPLMFRSEDAGQIAPATIVK